MLANSNGQKLTDHLRMVGSVAREMARVAGLDEDIQTYCEYAGYGHDLGKAVSWFREHMEAGTGSDVWLSKPMHHEISWAWLAGKYECPGRLTPVFNAIYWHHARPMDEAGKFFDSREEILKELSGEDLAAIEQVAANFDWARLFTQEADEDKEIAFPELFLSDNKGNSKTNATILAVRTCLISADRLVSALSPEEFASACEGRLSLGSLTEQHVPHRLSVDALCPDGYEADRFNIQQGCSEAAFSKKTVIAKAPAGFGKTIIGLLWGLKFDKQLLWVCPRNIVAEAVYRNLTKELAALGLNGVTAELHLTGERKAAVGECPELCSDIVVTNIDTILRPMVDNRVADRLFTVLASPMVLDEFHEFASGQPLFAAFVTLMRARHRLCGGVKTLLLSATPMAMRDLWDADGLETVYLPDGQSHYTAAHAGKYGIGIIENLPDEIEPGSLVVVNSVAMSQRIYRTRGMDHILHSRFTDSDRKEKTEAIFDGFGKGGEGVDRGAKVVSALVMQAAMDVSFRNLYESICSPEFTLQRIGRCDRWGTFQPLNPQIRILKPGGDRGEDGAVQTVYNKELRKDWLDFLEEFLREREEITLNDLYGAYNAFYMEKGSLINKHLAEKYQEGLDLLRKFYPVKIKGNGEEKSDGDEPATRGGRSLRNPFGSYYFSVRDENGNWLGPDNIMEEGRELEVRFDKTELLNEATGSGMLVHLKGLCQAGFPRYRRYTRKERPPASMKQWFRLARNPETPFPDFSRYYNSRIGLHERRNNDGQIYIV